VGFVAVWLVNAPLTACTISTAPHSANECVAAPQGAELLSAIETSAITQPTINSPYMDLAMHVRKFALKMETPAKEIAALLMAQLYKPLTKREVKRLETLYDTMDRQELRLLSHLNRSTV
jgi:hypothetical protein